MLPARFKPEEISAIYNLEKNLYSIFVEGPSDVSLIRWFLNFPKAKNVDIQPIENIDIPAVFTRKYNQENNNRGRVIALSKNLKENCNSKNLLCIADKDCGVLLNNLEQNEKLHYTDYSCIEMYYYEPETLKKYFQLSCNSHVENIESVMQNFSSILHRLFLIRAANLSLEMNLSGLEFSKKFLSVENNQILFNEERYITNYLGGNSALNKLQEFKQKIALLESEIREEARNYINKNDFLALLAFFVKKVLNEQDLCDVIKKGKHLVGVIERDQLKDYSLFKRVTGLIK